MSNRTLELRNCLIFVTLLLFGFASIPQAEATAQTRPQTKYRLSSLEGPNDKDEFEHWLDNFFAEVLSKDYRPAIPGVVFVLVKDDSIFFAKGYGYANIETKQPFDPKQTTVRAASVTKTLTATAIMQLVEQGKLDLNEDIHVYFPDLDFSSSFTEPITVGSLLTHSAGFDETPFRYSKKEALQTLSLYIGTKVPARVAAPNTVLTYSNYSYALAGRLIEIISGETYDEYIAKHILQPLNMNSSSVLAPVPQPLMERLATGYIANKDGFTPIPDLVYPPDEAGGGLTTTADDMAHFLIAHLQNGRFGKKHILEEETAKEMHAQHYTNVPSLPGYTYGFYERFDNGRRILMHGGGHRDAASLAVILPEEGVGFFISINRSIELSDGGDPREELFRAFMNRYYPETVKMEENFMKADQRFNGVYRITRYIHRGIEKALKMDAPLVQATVRVNSDGTITLSYPFNFVPPTHWRQIKPLLFQNMDKPSDLIAFQENENGQITHLFGTLITPFSLERVRWYETFSVQVSILGATAIVFLFVAFYLPLAALLRYTRKRKPFRTRLALLEWLIAMAGLVIIISLVVGNSTLIGDVNHIIGMLMIAGYGFVLLTCGMAISTINLWRKGLGAISSRIGFSVFTMTAIVFISFLRFWNIILA
jgi:CubicO group peptidase (beta-lactamase class C family)